MLHNSRKMAAASVAMLICLIIIYAVQPTFAQTPAAQNQILYLAYSNGVPMFLASNPDGSQTRLLTDAVLEQNAEITWMALSPDATHIVLSSRKERAPSYSADEILLLNVHTGTYGYLTNDRANNSLPVWSPDGSQIAFLRGAGSNGFSEAIVMDVESRAIVSTIVGTSFARLVQDDFGMVFRGVTWSPDGSKLLLSGITGLPDVKNPLIIVNPDGSSPQLAAPLDVRIAQGIGWSQFDSSVLFAGCVLANEASRLCRINLATGQIVPLSYPVNVPPNFPDSTPSNVFIAAENNVVLVYGFRQLTAYSYDFSTGQVIQILSANNLAIGGWVSPSFTISPILGEATPASPLAYTHRHSYAH
jgi:dipeptidyl aminopeptidase/acylaminoacyl peptidase